MNVNRGKMTAAAVLAVTLLVVGGVTGYGLHRAGTVGQPFVEDGRLKVMASFYPMYDFARKVGGDRIQVKDMVPAGTEPHDWEPAATDIRNLEDAEISFPFTVILPSCAFSSPRRSFRNVLFPLPFSPVRMA